MTAKIPTEHPRKTVTYGPVPGLDGHGHFGLSIWKDGRLQAYACIDPDTLGAALATETGGIWIAAKDIPLVTTYRSDVLSEPFALKAGHATTTIDADPNDLRQRAAAYLAIARHRDTQIASEQAARSSSVPVHDGGVGVSGEVVERAARAAYESAKVVTAWGDLDEAARYEWRSAIRAALDVAKEATS